MAFCFPAPNHQTPAEPDRAFRRVNGAALDSLPGLIKPHFHPPASAARFALLSTIANSLYTAVTADSRHEAADITFVVNATGLSLFSIGAALWGLVAAVVATLVFNKK